MIYGDITFVSGVKVTDDLGRCHFCPKEMSPCPRIGTFTISRLSLKTEYNSLTGFHFRKLAGFLSFPKTRV